MVATLASVEEYNILIQGTKNDLIVLDFTASWCNACTALSPHLNELQAKYASVKIRKVDVDMLSEIADAYQVSALPTIVFVKNQKICNKIVGVNINKLYECVEKHL